MVLDRGRCRCHYDRSNRMHLICRWRHGGRLRSLVNGVATLLEAAGERAAILSFAPRGGGLGALVAGIEAALSDRPAMTGIAIRPLLLRRLAILGSDRDVGRSRWRRSSGR